MKIWLNVIATERPWSSLNDARSALSVALLIAGIKNWRVGRVVIAIRTKKAALIKSNGDIKIEEIEAELGKLSSAPCLQISAVTRRGLEDLMQLVWQWLDDMAIAEAEAQRMVEEITAAEALTAAQLFPQGER